MAKCIWDGKEIVDTGEHKGPKKSGYCSIKCRKYNNMLNWLLKTRAIMRGTTVEAVVVAAPAAPVAQDAA